MHLKSLSNFWGVCSLRSVTHTPTYRRVFISSLKSVQIVKKHTPPNLNEDRGGYVVPLAGLEPARMLLRGI